MLQDLRKSTQGTAAKVVVGLIVISFSIFGIESILLGGSGGGVAEVNGEQVSPQELEQLVNTQRRRLIAMMGDNIDPAMLDEQRLTAQALETIIARKLQLQSATDMKMGISQQQISSVITSMEQFQIDGQFSPELYKNLLSNAGYTPASFKRGLQDDLVLSQLSSGLAGSDFATRAELELTAVYSAETRDIRYLTIPLDKFITDEKVSDADVEAYYNDNQAEFYTAESVELDYIELSVEEFVEPVDDTEVQDRYQQAQESYEFQTEWGVSHILFEQGADETDEGFSIRIGAVQEQLAAGGDFSDLAKQHSDDIGSASYGGELGFTRGDTFPEEMEQAITGLEEGKVSEQVVTDAGVHLIKVTELRETEMPSLEAMRPELEERIQLEAARRELALVVETLKDVAFNAEDLSAPAEELSLEVKQSDPISRGQDEGLFAHPALLAAAFSEDVLDQGHNSDVIELAKDTYIALRVRTHNEVEAKPLDDVRETIEIMLADAQARAAAQLAAEQALVALTEGATVEGLAKAQGYEWQVELAASRGSSMVPYPVLQRAFELPAPTDGESEFEYVASAAGDVLILELARVTAGALSELPPAQEAQLEQQVTAEYGGMVNNEYQRGLRDKADISVM
ncbi:MAG: SurA N-terminal domain-containing protein [Halioglobus sp.]